MLSVIGIKRVPPTFLRPAVVGRQQLWKTESAFQDGRVPCFAGSCFSRRIILRTFEWLSFPRFARPPEEISLKIYLFQPQTRSSFPCGRLLRGTKNRFGSTDEVGVFKMAQEGLVAVSDPSGFLLEDRDGNDSPTPVAVAALLEGTRPILVEIQVRCGCHGCRSGACARDRKGKSGFGGRRLGSKYGVEEPNRES